MAVFISATPRLTRAMPMRGHSAFYFQRMLCQWSRWDSRSIAAKNIQPFFKSALFLSTLDPWQIAWSAGRLTASCKTFSW
jgi:hypothetical protein